MDEKEDLLICQEIYRTLKETGKSINFTLYDVIDIVEKNMALLDLNKNIPRKKK